MRIKNILFFIVFYFSEIIVHAAMNSDYPHKCSLKRESAGACTVKTATPYVWRVDGYKIYLDAHSLLKYGGKGDFYIVKGKAWIKSEDQFKVSSAYGNVEVQVGEVFLKRDMSNFKIIAIKQSVKVKPKGEDDFILEPGFEINLGKITGRGVASFNIPKVINLNLLLNEWKNFYPARLENFSDDVAGLGKIIWRATQREQEISTWLYNSRVDDLTFAYRRKVQEKLNSIDKNNALIKLFRKKSNFE